MSRPRSGPPRVGVVTYDLQGFTADCLNRLSRAFDGSLTAYPVFSRRTDEPIEFAFRPSRIRGRFFSLGGGGHTPEGLTSTVNVTAALRCAWENDIVVLFGIQGGTAVLVTLVGRLFRRRLVSVNQTLPAAGERRRRAWVRAVKGWVLRRCQVHVVQTPPTSDTLEQVYGLDPSTFVSAPFEAGGTAFRGLLGEQAGRRDQRRRELAWPEGACVFLFAGTLLGFKGVQTLLRAIGRLRDVDPPVRLAFAGPEAGQAAEPGMAALRATAERLGVADRVDFLGRLSLNDLAATYLAADVFVLPTARDMWPKVLVEAALAGLPLVTSSACGAAGSLVEEGRTGRVVPPEDEALLAAAMRHLLDADRRRELGRRARDRADALCDPQAETSGLVRALDLALRGRGPGSTHPGV